MSKKTPKITNVVVAGLGGQGVLKASDILADAAFQAGYDVKKSELHGMSQRGGSVSSDVRFGERIYSPMIPFGEADYLLVLSDDQIEINKPVLRSGGVLIVPETLSAEDLSSKRSLNVALLGALSAYLEIPEELWIDAIKESLPPKLHEANCAAFQIGRNTIAKTEGSL